MKKFILYIFLLTISGVINAKQEENTKFILAGDETLTPVSGYAGGYKELGGNGPYSVLSAILWGEKANNPCAAMVTGRHINNFSLTMNENNLGDYVWGGYKLVSAYSGVLVNKIKYGYAVKLGCNGNRKSIAPIGNSQYIRKINVCTTDKKTTYKNKLKGIRIWTRSLEYSNYDNRDSVKMLNEKSYHETKHKHCKKWHKPVACPKGQIATKIRLHYNGSKSKNNVSGIALICKEVKFKQTSPVESTPTPRGNTL